MAKNKQEFIATSAKVEDSMVVLELEDGSTHSFPVLYYPKLAAGSREDLSDVKLRVGGRALRWEHLDEDIWITDAVCQNYPGSKIPAVAEAQAHFEERPCYDPD